MPAKKAAGTVAIKAPSGGAWEVAAKIAGDEKVTPALRKQALATATTFLENPVLPFLTGVTPAKLKALTAQVANPPPGTADTSKLMKEILGLAEKARAFLESAEEEEEEEGGGGAAPAARAVKAAKKPAAAARKGVKAAAKSASAKAKAAGAKKPAAKAGKPLDVAALVQDAVKSSGKAFEASALKELVKGATSMAASAKQAPKAAKKAAKAKAPAKKVRPHSVPLRAPLAAQGRRARRHLFCFSHIAQLPFPPRLFLRTGRGKGEEGFEEVEAAGLSLVVRFGFYIQCRVSPRSRASFTSCRRPRSCRTRRAPPCGCSS